MVSQSDLFTTCVGFVEVHEEGRHDQEERVRHRVEELGDERAERVVLLAPVHGRAPAGQVVRQHHVHGGMWNGAALPSE